MKCETKTLHTNNNILDVALPAQSECSLHFFSLHFNTLAGPHSQNNEMVKQ